MANLEELNQYDAGVYQIETTDPVLGGPSGIANQQAKQLANRTKYLKDRVDKLEGGQTIPAGVATESYVQRQLNMLDAKQSVRIATTANISLSGSQTIDGVNVVAGDRVLVKNQTDARANGIYIASGSTWSRAGDADESPEVTSGLEVYVEEGTLQGKSRWQLTTLAPIVLGTSTLVFSDITSGFAPLKSPAFTDTPTAPKAPQFATGSQIMNADAVKERGVAFSKLRSIDMTASNVSLAVTDAGAAVMMTGSGGGALTLPAASSCAAGTTIWVHGSNSLTSTNQLKTAATDTFSGGYSALPNGTIFNTLTLRAGDTVCVTSDGNNVWHVTSETSAALINYVIAKFFTDNMINQDNGCVTLPGGLLLQWGTIKTTATDVTVTLPRAWTVGPKVVVQSIYNDTTTSTDQVRRLTPANNLTSLRFRIVNPDGGTAVCWYAIGI